MLDSSRTGVFVCFLVGAMLAPLAVGATDLLEALSDGSRVDLPELDPSVPSPAEHLGYPLGSRFTHHERIVDYLERLAEASPRVRIREYGRTYEGRPLELLTISSPENLARLDSVQAELQSLARAAELPEEETDALVDTVPIAVWLAYGVHGNESSSAEAAMAAAYVFAAAGGEWTEFLENAVILIDPLCNPDGRERYVHFFETHRGRSPDPLAASAEHFEPWPGGRQNHYLVDLNRDWAWITQRETGHRIQAYRAWDPQVYVDFHEMSSQSSYFFPPAAEPIHPNIAPKALYWLERFGRANAAAFDSRGWVYYVGERFDLFYPGYGDSYPSLRGAIGMTYEMAGHGRAGQAIERPDGSVLTLADRVARHLTTSIATARTAIENRTALLSDFADARRQGAREARTYLWTAGQQEARTAAELLARHGVEVGMLTKRETLRAQALSGGEPETRAFPAGTYAVSTRQPLGALIRSLMDLDASISQSFLEKQRQRLESNLRTEFYDITAWSLPLAYNLEAFVSKAPAPALEPLAEASPEVAGGNLGFLIRPQGLAGYRLASGLQARTIAFRVALHAFTLGDKDYPSGTIFVPRRGNGESLEDSLADLARSAGVSVEAAESGYAEKGNSLGSDSVVSVLPPRVGLVSGDGVSPTSFGFLWHLLDQQVRAPHHRLSLASLDRVELADFDVLIFPSGRYSSISEQLAQKVDAWVRDGGVLVAVGQASGWLRKSELSSIKAWQPPEPDTKPNAVTEVTPSNRNLYTPGAALGTEIRRPHPLTIGMDRSPAAIFSGTSILLPTGNPRYDVVVATKDDPVVAGFAWPEAIERLKGSLLVGLEPKGRGAMVVFSQDPSFRLFWRGTAPVFLNSVLYGPSFARHGHLR
ncbi:MAG: M14 family zinc carboxypeptidase [Thermoanaerobaculia bacterium]